MFFNPPTFQETDIAALKERVAAAGLVTLITVGADGPIVSHLPLAYDPNAGPLGALTGHLSRANAQWRDTDVSKPALAMIMGEDAYVSPGWYPSKAEHGKAVPTWNYRTIYLRGRVAFFDDIDRLRQNVEALTARLESGSEIPWSVTDAPADYLARQLKGIVGVQLTVEAIEGKSKLSQNRTPADQRGVAAGLERSVRAADRQVAALMRANLARG